MLGPCLALPRLPLVALVLTLAACGGATTLRGARSRPLVEREVNRETFSDVRREYLVLAPDDAARRVVQERLLRHLDEGSEALIASGDYEAVVRRLAAMTELLAPIDLADGAHLPAVLGPLAHFVAERGAPRGDEARVLAALLLLSRISPDEAAEHDAEYERAAVWGHDARLGQPGEVRSLIDQLEGGQSLVDLWEEHARLSPAPEVIDRLAHLHVELRDRLAARGETGFAPPRSMADLEAMSYVSAMIERAPLEVAATYLRVGDLALARDRVREMGDGSGTEFRVRSILEDALGDDEDGAEALLQLSMGFGEVRPDVSVAVCRNGRRRFPSMAEFPLCLARLSAEVPADAVAWYAEAVRLSPDDRDLYDEALAQVPELLEHARTDESDIGAVRGLVMDAEWILEERNRRWPSEPSELTLAALRLALADAEAAAGHLDDARTALESSLALERSIAGLAELGGLELSTSHHERAIALFTEAIDSLTDQSAGGRLQRGLLLSQLADAHRLAGHGDVAATTYRQAFDMLSALTGRGPSGSELAFLDARLGVLARRLGDRPGSDQQLRAAMRVTPDEPSPFAEALAALVVVEPDAALAAEAFHGARVGSALEPAWKIYFALWAQIASERAGTTVDPEVIDVLEEHAAGEGWHARLAGLATGHVSEGDLLAAASTVGERCEAHFYSGARRLAAGDRAGAHESFRAAVATGMVRYWEYRMALELLALP